MVPALGAGVPSVHPDVWEVLLKEVGCGLRAAGVGAALQLFFPWRLSRPLAGIPLAPYASHPRLELGSPGEALKQDLSRAPPSEVVLSYWSWGGTCLVIL